MRGGEGGLPCAGFSQAAVIIGTRETHAENQRTLRVEHFHKDLTLHPLAIRSLLQVKQLTNLGKFSFTQQRCIKHLLCTGRGEESLGWALKESKISQRSLVCSPGPSGQSHMVTGVAGSPEMDQLSLEDQRNIPRRCLPGCGGNRSRVFREQGVAGRG